MEGCCVLTVFKHVAAFGVHVGAGVSSASISDTNSALMDPSDHWMNDSGDDWQ